METHEGDPHGIAASQEHRADPDEVRSDRYKVLPPAVAISATVAVVGVALTVPVGPEGSGGDGD